jgi:hypothetical protein
MRPFILTAAMIAAASSGVAIAQDRDGGRTALERIYACRATAADAQRLACYDAAAAGLDAAQTAGGAVAVTPGSGGAPAATAGTMQAGNMQAGNMRAGDMRTAPIAPTIRGGMPEAEPYRVTAKVERILAQRSGRSVFYMSNGQVWTQVEAETVRNVRAGDEVTINSASFGSFLMSSPRGGRAIRVRLTAEN